MNASVADAIAFIRAQSRIRNIHVVEKVGGDCVLSCEVDTDLPSTWKANGQSPSGVRSWEPLEIWFSHQFPMEEPLITLREDFRADIPHINYFKQGERVPPCLVHGSLHETLHTEGIGRLIWQLYAWLERAANGDLINKDFGWEPTRRSEINDWLYLDIDAVASATSGLGGFQIIRINVMEAENLSCSWVVGPFLKKRLNSDDAILLAQTSAAYAANKAQVIQTVAAIFWPFADKSGVVPVDSSFRPDTISTLGELIERADECNLGILVRRYVENIAAAFFLDAPNPVDLPLYLILAIQRPFHLLGYETSYELLAYKVNWPVRELAVHEVDAMQVKPVAILNVINQDLLRRTSGLTPQNFGIQTAILGCGSLGSKVALHLSRAGYVPSLYIDPDHFAIHNSARNVLPPKAAYSSTLKADQLGKLCVRFVPVGAVTQWPIPIEKIGQIKDAKGSCLYSFFVVVTTTTASNSARRFLAGADVAARVVEACALNLGRNAAMTTEGPGRNPNAEDLMAFAYEQMRQASSLHVQDDANQNPLRVGVGCNSVTLPMADSQISLVAASVSQAILQYQERGLPKNGRVSLSQLGEDGMSLSWSHWTVGPTMLADRSDTDGWKVRILDIAHQKILVDVAAHPHVETGGLIVGRISPVSREVTIVDVLQAPADSTRSPALFVLGAQGRTELIEQYNASAKGVLWCLGTWHSHLEPIGPSPTDIRTADELRANLKPAAVLLIRRPDGYSVVVKSSYN